MEHPGAMYAARVREVWEETCHSVHHFLKFMNYSHILWMGLSAKRVKKTMCEGFSVGCTTGFR